MPWYAVDTGESKDVYTSWSETSQLVTGVSGVRYKKFHTEEEAYTWLGITADSTTSDDELHVYTDGACTCNGTPRAKGGIGVFFAVGDPRNISAPLPQGMKATNNTAELLAIEAAIDTVRHDADVNNLVVHTDSQYAHKALTTWINAWIKNNWQTKKGTPVNNRELIERIYCKLQEEPPVITLEYIKAHCGNYGNTQADLLAKAGAKK